MPINHVGLHTSDIASFSKFYDAALAPLGYSLMLKLEEGKVLGYCDGTGPNFWIAQASEEILGKGTRPVHVAFDCKSQEQVDEFYKAAIAAGAKDNGPPGLRSYTKGYYAAFVLDPEGNNIEAVHHDREAGHGPAPPA